MVCNVLVVISQEAKDRLDRIKEHPRETYGDVVERLSKEEEVKKWEDKSGLGK